MRLFSFALVVLACCAAQATELTFGVLSDVHLDRRHFEQAGGGCSVRVFRAALEFMRDRRVDGVVICGDLTQDGQISELKRLAAVWNEVFPNDRRPDGGHVERLFIFGDHDVEKPYLYLKYWPEKLKSPEVIADLTLFLRTALFDASAADGSAGHADGRFPGPCRDGRRRSDGR